MLLTELLLSLILCLAHDGAYAESAPRRSQEDCETLVENLEFRLRDVETRVHEKLEAKDKEMETRLGEMEDKIKEGEKRERELEASVSKLKIEVEESLRKEIVSNLSNSALAKPSLRDLPIVLISAWRADELTYPQTVTFDSFLTNFNNADRPGGGSGVLDLDSGVFTCLTPGYYTVSYSAYARSGPDYTYQDIFMYKNGLQLPESFWHFGQNDGALRDNVGVTCSRILVCAFPYNDNVDTQVVICQTIHPQILHLDAGDTLELRMTAGELISQVTLNIELTGLGFDYLV